MQQLDSLEDIVGEMSVELPFDRAQLIPAFFGETFRQIAIYDLTSVAHDVVQQNECHVGQPVQKPERHQRHAVEH